MPAARWMLLILCLVVVSGMLLSARHQRLRLMHETVELHGELREARQELWAQQATLNAQLGPLQLDQLAREVGVALPRPNFVERPSTDLEGEASLVDAEGLTDFAPENWR